MRKYSGVFLGLLLSVFVAGVALAEGSWNSYIINAQRGFNSRTWRDNDVDPAGTKIYFRDCRDEDPNNGTNDWGKIRLMRHAGFFPPYQVGPLVTYYCYGSSYVSYDWGEQVGAEDFHFNLTDFSGGTGSWNKFDVGGVIVQY